MRITQLRLQGRASNLQEVVGADLVFGGLSPHLNAFYGPPRSGKTTAGDLIAHLLYGRLDHKCADGQRIEGGIRVNSREGEFELQRHRDGSPQGRLTIAAVAANGEPSHGPVDGRTIRTLLGGMRPQLLAQLYAVDFRDSPRIEALLAGEFVDEFTAADATKATLNRESHDLAYESHHVCRQHDIRRSTSTVSRRIIDDLVRRRDELARQIEVQMADRRTDSALLERELQELDVSLDDRRRRAEQLQSRLAESDGRLAEMESRLRYFSLESTVRRGTPVDSEAHRGQLAEIDAEIGRCRQMLSDQQAREAVVRRELAKLHPDGAADGLASLADQRATLTVLERLLDDLDAEVSLLARSRDPARCVGRESHARITPVAQMLRQQVYTMCGQLTEQQRAARRQQLQLEERHLTRSQTDLSEQLEHLLWRRQLLTHETQLANQSAVMLPQAPIDTYCQCEQHQQFVAESDAMLLGRVERTRYQDDADRQRTALQCERTDLADELDDLQHEIAAAQAQWEQLQQQRGRLVGQTSLDELRNELARMEDEIARSLRTTEPTTRIHAAGDRRGGWRASDVLAQLTDGRLTQIRINCHGNAVTVVDRSGSSRPISRLTPAEGDQVYLALTLALVNSQAERGVHLPLVIDEPFLHQDAAGAAAMAGVLHDFAGQGRQTFVFTEDRNACRRIESLGVDVLRIDQSRMPEAHRPESPPPIPDLAVETKTSTNVRVVRESAAGSGPRLRVMADSAPRDNDRKVYYLTLAASLQDFPVLGPDTQQAFAAIGLRTIDELLNADPESVAVGLDRNGITTETVVLWQTHMSLMCFIPGVSLDDAQVFAACGIDSPGDLYDLDLDELSRLVDDFFASERGARFTRVCSRFNRNALDKWQRSARRNRERWTRASSRRRSRLSNRQGKLRSQRNGRGDLSRRSSPRTEQKTARKKRELRFFLERSSDVTDAPSIGPKTAQRLAAVGIRTVADLLNADAESTAAEIDASHIKAETIAAWQHQARLVCCIPELRGYGAQLLVGCGFTEAEQVAATDEDELTKLVHKFAKSKPGQRIVRDGGPPSEEKIADWIEHAGNMRPLEAA